MKLNSNPNEINSLIEKGFLFESETLTTRGRFYTEELLLNPLWIKEYLKLAIELFSKYPLNQRKILWKNILRNLASIRERERSLNVPFVKD